MAAEEKRITLSMLNIIGDSADLRMPRCVICEILDAHGIDFDMALISKPDYCRQLVETINNTNVESVPMEIQDWKKEDYQYVARFINKEVPWTTKIVKQPFKHLYSFFGKEDYSDYIGKDVKFGIQTLTEPLRLNLTIAYKICLVNNIETIDLNTSEKILINTAKLALLSDSSFKRDFVSISLATSSRKELISMYAEYNTKKTKK